MYLVEVKVGDTTYTTSVYTPQQLGELIQSNMKQCHYIKVLKYIPDTPKMKRKGARNGKNKR